MDTCRVFGCILMVCVVGGVAGAAGADYQSSAIPVKVDFGSVYAVDMYLKCQTKVYGQSFHEYVAAQRDPKSTRFGELARALSRKDSVRSKELAGAGKLGRAEQDRLSNALPGYMNLFSADMMGANLEKLFIDREFVMGNRSLIVFGADETSDKVKFKGKYRQTIELVTDANGVTEWDAGAHDMDSISNTLLECARSQANSPSVFVSKKPTGAMKQVRIGGNDTAPVSLEFRAMRASEVGTSSVIPDAAEALGFHSRAYDILRREGPKAFAGLYTQGSQQKYLSWVTSVDPNYLAGYLQREKAGHKPVFIIAAPPFYFVVCRSAQGSIEIDDVFRDPADGTFRLTNFHYEDYIHRLLKDKAIQKVLVQAME